MRTGIRLLIPKHRIGVNVVCLDSENNILMLKHLFHPLAPWGLPGGWMDRNESPAECAMRELREETKLTTAVAGEIIFSFRNPHPDHINMVIMAQIDGIKPNVTIDGSEIIDSRWVTPESVPDQLTIHTYLAMQKAWATKNLHYQFAGETKTQSAF